MEILVKRLRRDYFLFLFVSIFSGILIVKNVFFTINKDFNVSLESISILLTLFGIWGTYKLFHIRLKKIVDNLAEEKRFSAFEKIFRTSLLLLFIVITINVLAFGFTHMRSNLLCVGMTLIAGLLIYPTENKIKTYLQIEELE